MILRKHSIFVFCLLSLVINAQNGLEIGVKAIPGYSMIVNFQDYSNSNKFIANFGLSYGFEVAYSLDEYLSIRSGYYYSYIGDTYIDGNVWKAYIQWNYTNLSCMLLKRNLLNIITSMLNVLKSLRFE